MKRCTSFILVLLLLISLVPFSASAASSMKASGSIITYIKSKEGCELTAYKNPGEKYYTIGYGHYGPDVKEGQTITQAEADRLFAEDLKKFETAVNGYIDRYDLSFNQSKFDAIVSLTYNCGTNWVDNSWRIATYLKNDFKYSNGDPIPDQEIADAFGVICSGGDGIMTGLIKRRIDEAKIFLYGDYKGTGSHDFVYVLLDANGGTLTAGNRVVIYTKGQHYSSMPEATKTGYYLYGWKSAGGTCYTNRTLAKTNANLTAVWKKGTAPTKYTVTVNGGFGSGKNAAGAKVYISPYEKSGYQFTGWSSSAADLTISKDSDGFYYFTMPKKSVTLTAKYEEIKTAYDVTVKNGGGSGKYEVGSKVYIYPLSTEEKFGYKISSWQSNEVTVKGSATKGFYFTMPSKDVTVTGVYVKGCNRFENCPSLDYCDVGEMHWAHYEIDYCIGSRLLIGTSTTTFEPDEPMTRAMVATVLYRLADAPSVSGKQNPYTDVSDDYYRDAAVWMHHSGINLDDGYGFFRPDDIVTRQEFAYLLYKFSGSSATDADLTKFKDVDNIDEQYLDAMKWAVAGGILVGTDEATLEPASGASRAEIAAMLYRFLGIVNSI